MQTDDDTLKTLAVGPARSFAFDLLDNKVVVAFYGQKRLVAACKKVGEDWEPEMALPFDEVERLAVQSRNAAAFILNVNSRMRGEE